MFLIDFISLFSFSYLLVVMLNIIPSVYERLALSLVLTLGIKSLLVYFLIAAGLKPEIARQTVLSLGAFVIGLGLYWFKFRNVSVARKNHGIGVDQGHTVIAIVVISVLVALSLMNALFFPITEGDGVWHEIRGIRLFHEHRFDLDGYHYNSYAPFLHLLYVYLISIDIERFKILFPVFYLCLLTICYHRLCIYHKKQKIAAVFTLILATTPYFWWHSVLPFLNLVTGFYFATASVYWFFLINELLADPAGDRNSMTTSLALLSGLFFGLAAWTRLEFLLYDAIPFAGLIYILDQKTELAQSKKNRIFLSFSCPVLGLSALWLITTLTFKVSHGIHIYGVVTVCALLGVCALMFVFGVSGKISKAVVKNYGLCAVMTGLLFLILLSTKGPTTVSPGQAVLLGLYRTVFFNVFYSATLFLALLLFFDRLKSLAGAEKFLGGFLIAYLCMHFAVYTFGEPKWKELSAYIDATFVHFGNSVNSSGTREMLAFYPVFIVFVSCLPGVKESMAASIPSRMRNFVYAVAVLNLLALTAVFIYPRGRFMLSNMHLTSSGIMETAGTPDMPNYAYEAYRMLNRIRETTDSSATVFLPPLEGAHRSHPLQRLYPRKLFWGDLQGFQENMSKLPQNSYFITRPDWHPDFCDNKPRVKLNGNGYWMCRVDEGK